MMRKKLTLLVLLTLLFTTACTMAEPSNTVAEISQSLPDLNSYRQTIEINQSQSGDSPSATNSQISTATVIQDKGFEGKVVLKNSTNQNQLLSVISKPQTTIYKKNSENWQYSATPNVQLNRINMMTYSQEKDVLASIQSNATGYDLPSRYIINFEGENTQLQSLINKIVQEDYTDKVTHKIQMTINKNTKFIEKINWQARGKSNQNGEELNSQIILTYANQNETHVDGDFANIDKYDVKPNEE